MIKAKIFKSGNSQAIRLPKDYRFSGDEVLIKKIGNALIILPQKSSWQIMFDSLGKFSDDFMETREQPKLENREIL